MRTLILIAAVGLATIAAADDYGWDPASLDIGGQHILKFRTGALGMTAAERRAMLEFRLTRALTYTEYLHPVEMSYKKVPGGIAIAANGIYLITVTPADATINRSTVQSLARQWGARIKRTFEIVGPARQLPHELAAEPGAPISLD